MLHRSIYAVKLIIVRNFYRYWGKRDTKLILPTNSSLSVTLDQDHLRSTTTSRADPSFTKDRLWLNGKEEEIKEGGRLATCISEMKRLRKEVEKKDGVPRVSINNYIIFMVNHSVNTALRVLRSYMLP